MRIVMIVQPFRYMHGRLNTCVARQIDAHAWFRWRSEISGPGFKGANLTAQLRRFVLQQSRDYQNEHLFIFAMIYLVRAAASHAAWQFLQP